MDVLVAVGTNAAYFYSVYIVFKASTSNSFKGKDFFETSSMLISFILLGKYLEVMAKGKSSDALAQLAHLAPDTACLMTFDDHGNLLSEVEIDTQLIQRNDIIKIVPGAKVPVDGVVISGESNVNESTITGEARSIGKSTGDKVLFSLLLHMYKFESSTSPSHASLIKASFDNYLVFESKLIFFQFLTMIASFM